MPCALYGRNAEQYLFKYHHRTSFSLMNRMFLILFHFMSVYATILSKDYFTHQFVSKTFKNIAPNLSQINSNLLQNYSHFFARYDLYVCRAIYEINWNMKGNLKCAIVSMSEAIAGDIFSLKQPWYVTPFDRFDFILICLS